jgi:hypothetical protein
MNDYLEFVELCQWELLREIEETNLELLAVANECNLPYDV